MNRAGLLALSLLIAVAFAGCGGRQESSEPELSFEELSDTTGLSRGGPLITRIEPYRMSNGALRVRGRVRFPDGVRIQVSVHPAGSPQLLARFQVLVGGGGFDSPPVLGPEGPLPAGAYRFEYLSLFNEAWQTPEVLGRTDHGRRLRGPGMTRDRAGGAAFYLVEEHTL